MRLASQAAGIALALALGAIADPARAIITHPVKLAPIQANRANPAMRQARDSSKAATIQLTTPAPLPAGESETATPEAEAAVSSWAPTVEVWLSILILTFGCLVLGLEFLLLRGSRTHLSAESILRAIGVTTIIIGALFCITAGFSPQQIAPATGLFGTVAGYLLGKETVARARGARPDEEGA
jgi:hypothetical protein